MAQRGWKQTNWTELDWDDAEILEDDNGGESVLVKHPDLARARWFVRSKAGNYYSRYTGKESSAYAEGYIFKGEPPEDVRRY